jgi:c-di-GMP-binding flagellar brake protein YcgR
MAEIEKISGKAVLKLLTNLQLDKIPLKIRWKDEDRSYSTCVADIRKRKRRLHFLINAPEAFLSARDPGAPSKLRFEFIDKENIKYVFETGAGLLSRAMMWVAFPEFVRRYQRRSLFRLDAPPGTQVYFNVNDVHYKLLVINVSLGGTLGVLVSFSQQMDQKLTACESQVLQDVELHFPPKKQKEQASVVEIKRCRIKRKHRNPLTRKYECAIEFTEIDEQEQEKLTQIFYSWQRKYLRLRRLKQVKS